MMNLALKRVGWLLALVWVGGQAAVLATDPFRVAVSREPGEIVLSWPDLGSDRAYVVQVRDQIEGAPWRTPRGLHPWPIREARWVDPMAEAAQYYRVVAVEGAERGRLVSHQELGFYSAAQVNFLLLIGGVQTTVQHDVRVYRVVYETIDPWGGRTRASGAVALPQGVAKPLPLCSYQHGTLAKRSEVPSVTDSRERLLGIVMAGTGYATALPDYLGLGESTLVQSYHHAGTEATAGVDLLRATRAFCAARSVALNEQLFLLGYSHGGHATLALHRELEEFHADEFVITASAPMAGAYDLSGVMTDDFLSGRRMPNPYYFALLLASYQDVYRLAGSLAEWLAPAYRAVLPPLLDGNHTGSEINAVMPPDVVQVLEPNLLAAFQRDPQHPLRLALRDNDLIRWTPRAPLRLYHCAGDADVLFANSQKALQSFHARGATQVQLIDPQPTADHGDCVLPSLLLGKAWFDSLKQ